MNNDTTKKQRYLTIAGAVTLITGLAGSLVIYLTARSASEDSMIFEYENSKMYARSLKLYGGNMAVLADGFKKWFAGLWHGQTLAGTVACMTVTLAAALFLEARYLRSVRNDAK